MEEKDKPVYPIYDGNFLRPGENSYGLTKREYFAAMALQGILASATNTGYVLPEAAADRALCTADFLLELLNKKD